MDEQQQEKAQNVVGGSELRQIVIDGNGQMQMIGWWSIGELLDAADGLALFARRQKIRAIPGEGSTKL